MHPRTSFSVASVLAIVLALALWPATAGASRPVARTFAELKAEIVVGDKLTVVDKAGATSVGKLVRLSESELTIDTLAGPRTFNAGDVIRVDCRRRGPLWNGALIGAIAGGVPAIFLFRETCCYGTDTHAFWTGMGLLSIAVGTTTGTLIDYAKAGDVKVFEAQPKTARTFSVAPVISSARKGVVFRVAW